MHVRGSAPLALVGAVVLGIHTSAPAAPLRPDLELQAQKGQYQPIDRAILQNLADETRLAALAPASDGPRLATVRTGPTREVHNLRARIHNGLMTRDQFLKTAPGVIEKNRRQLQQSGDGGIKQVANSPDAQARLFALLLLDAVNEMRLAENTDLATSYLQQVGRGIGDAGNGGLRSRPAEHDAEWLANFQSTTSSELLKRLPQPAQQDLINVWPVLFPDGPAAPGAPAKQQDQHDQRDRPDQPQRNPDRRDATDRNAKNSTNSTRDNPTRRARPQNSSSDDRPDRPDKSKSDKSRKTRKSDNSDDDQSGQRRQKSKQSRDN